LLNADITVIAEKPKLAPYIEAMRKRLAESLHIHAERISVKATTSEGMGFTGRGEGVAAQAAVIVFKRGQSGREALLPPDTENES
ncbi:MAG: 2-C-methyl-D-erythritol 2,4-cyclodiphosphate synthase, partial [Clostridiales Family XIII bacterium]|nr:2-C-methyl-D-erythritol 2,4-cyclodiphosphate synthase [Clostridiales Family XIII bacterium]